MKRLPIVAGALALLMLPGCAQKPAPEAGFKDQSALPYVQTHGLKVDVQLPQSFVGASTVIDSQAALKAASSSHNLVASSGNTAGLAGLLVASLINTAKLHAVEPFAWLKDALERVVSGQTKAHPLDDLLPWQWKANAPVNP